MGEAPLPNERQEKFARAMASGAVTQGKAIQAAYGPRKSASQMGNNLMKELHVAARIEYLRRERAGNWADFDEVSFDGFEDLLTKVLDDVSELVRLCESNGLSREAASARDVLTTISSRILAQLDALRAADAANVVAPSRVMETLALFNTANAK